MPQSLKRKAMESPFDVTENLLHFKRQWFNLLQLTFAKFRDSYGDPWPKRKGEKRKWPDYRKIALLTMTIICYKMQRMVEENEAVEMLQRMLEEEAEEMFQNDSPLQETIWSDTPRSYNPGAAEMFMESRKESPSTSNAWETGGASEMGNTLYSASLFSKQPAGQGPQEDPGCGPSSSDVYEILDNIEDLLMNPGEAQVAGDGLFASSSEDLIPTFQMETSVYECLTPEEPLNNPSPGILEALVATYLGDLSVEGYFEEIDISEFMTAPAPQPREEETTPVYPGEEASEVRMQVE